MMMSMTQFIYDFCLYAKVYKSVYKDTITFLSNKLL